jgi:urate oxidase
MYSIIDTIFETKEDVLSVLPGEKLNCMEDAMRLNYKVTHNMFDEPLSEELQNQLYKLTRRLINLYQQKFAYNI